GGFDPEQRSMLGALGSQYNVYVFDSERLSDLTVFIDEKVRYLTRVLGRHTADGSVSKLAESIRGWRRDKPRVSLGYRVDASYSVDDLRFFTDEGELTPSRKTLPINLVTPAGVSMESVLPRLIDVDGDLVFSTEHRNLPFVMKFSLGEESSLRLGFELDKANVSQAVAFEEFLAAFIEAEGFDVVDPSTGRRIIGFSRGVSFSP
ncbi:hypothetical protein JXL21_03355, partial [Candidatus Bathyarchaeota archaeon]|nr:hypothetical protein [Candidatus Bathyarchaeota archaeon]